jgi:hypothetical protein
MVKHAYGGAMKARLSALLLVLIVTSTAFAQDRHSGISAETAQTNRQFQFEVVSIRLHAPQRKDH